MKDGKWHQVDENLWRRWNGNHWEMQWYCFHEILNKVLDKVNLT